MKNAPVYKAKFSNIYGCIFFIAIFIPAIARAQGRGTVEVIKDPRIDTLAAGHFTVKISRPVTTIAAVVTPSGIAATTATTTTVVVPPPTGTRVQVEGYRVQIFSGSGRKDAYDAMARFSDIHQGISTHIVYNEPNYKVRVGDFRSRMEAERFMQELRQSFTSLFIIEEKINTYKADTAK